MQALRVSSTPPTPKPPAPTIAALNTYYALCVFSKLENVKQCHISCGPTGEGPKIQKIGPKSARNLPRIGPESTQNRPRIDPEPMVITPGDPPRGSPQGIPPRDPPKGSWGSPSGILGPPGADIDNVPFYATADLALSHVFLTDSENYWIFALITKMKSF